MQQIFNFVNTTFPYVVGTCSLLWIINWYLTNKTNYKKWQKSYKKNATTNNKSNSRTSNRPRRNV